MLRLTPNCYKPGICIFHSPVAHRDGQITQKDSFYLMGLPVCIVSDVFDISASGFMTDDAGSCGSRVEPASCYQRVAGLIPLDCMLKSPWARY